MALIKCPECGKEVSDKAKACPMCKCVLKKETLKDCPECHRCVDISTEICPYCGYPFQAKDKKQKMRRSMHIGKKSLVIIGAIAILIICFVLFKKENEKNNVFKKYADYIGQSYEKLPDNYDTQEILNGLWQAKRVLNAGDEKFAFIDGTIQYNYFDEKSDPYDTKANEIFAMSWKSDYEEILDIGKEETEKTIEELKKLLEETYGEFDEELELDNTSEVFQYEGDSFLCKRYLWDNIKGIDIFMDVESKYDDEIGDEMCTSINITWRKHVK